MPSKSAYHSVALSEDAFIALKQLQDDIAEDLGFPPTYSQAVLHVLHKLRNISDNNDNENSSKNI